MLNHTIGQQSIHLLIKLNQIKLSCKLIFFFVKIFTFSKQFSIFRGWPLSLKNMPITENTCHLITSSSWSIRWVINRRQSSSFISNIWLKIWISKLLRNCKGKNFTIICNWVHLKNIDSVSGNFSKPSICIFK